MTEPTNEPEPSLPERTVETTVRSIIVRSRSALRTSVSSAIPPRGITLAKPQSTTWTSPKLPIITFAGLRSRWITPRACA